MECGRKPGSKGGDAAVQQESVTGDSWLVTGSRKLRCLRSGKLVRSSSAWGRGLEVKTLPPGGFA
jgi:hypothetical protein